jgi:hypothetical protein
MSAGCFATAPASDRVRRVRELVDRPLRSVSTPACSSGGGVKFAGGSSWAYGRQRRVRSQRSQSATGSIAVYTIRTSGDHAAELNDVLIFLRPEVNCWLIGEFPGPAIYYCNFSASDAIAIHSYGSAIRKCLL